MNLQISPGGIILALPLYWLAFLGMRRLWQRVGSNPKYWFIPYLAPIVLVLPFADEFLIAWNFERNCKEAGVTVSRQVEAEGFFDATGSPGTDMIDKLGFRFTEGLTLGDKGIAHVEKIDGAWKRTIYDRPQARYHFRRAHETT